MFEEYFKFLDLAGMFVSQASSNIRLEYQYSEADDCIDVRLLYRQHEGFDYEDAVKVYFLVTPGTIELKKIDFGSSRNPSVHQINSIFDLIFYTLLYIVDYVHGSQDTAKSIYQILSFVYGREIEGAKDLLYMVLSVNSIPYEELGDGIIFIDGQVKVQLDSSVIRILDVVELSFINSSALERLFSTILVLQYLNTYLEQSLIWFGDATYYEQESEDVQLDEEVPEEDFGEEGIVEEELPEEEEITVSRIFPIRSATLNNEIFWNEKYFQNVFIDLIKQGVDFKFSKDKVSLIYDDFAVVCMNQGDSVLVQMSHSSDIDKEFQIPTLQFSDALSVIVPVFLTEIDGVGRGVTWELLTE